ncbi:MAG TPA: hypothetical protein VIP28_02060 [Nocardioides sp.]
MRYDQRPPQVDAMRFIPDDPAADLAAVNAWMTELQVGVDPTYVAILRTYLPQDDETFPGWKPGWILAQAESSSGPVPLVRPVSAGDWILFPPNPASAQAWAMDDTSFNQAYVLA